MSTASVVARRINAKTLAGVTRAEKIKLEGNSQTLGVIAGVASSYKLKDSNFGGSIELGGDFTAISEINGITTHAPKAYIPEPFSSIVKSAIELAVANGQPAAVQFAIEISLVKSTTEAGYEYQVKNLMPQTAENVPPSLKLLAQIQEAQASLPAPASKKK